MKPPIPYPEIDPKAREKLDRALQDDEAWIEAYRRKRRHVPSPTEERVIHEVVRNEELLG